MRSLARLASTAAAFLAVALGFAQGDFVLCAGADGHLALEPAHRLESCAVPAAAESGCGGEACHEDCGPCRDARVGAGDSAVRGREGADAAPGALIAAPSAPLSTAPALLAIAHRAEARAASLARLRVRTGSQLRL